MRDHVASIERELQRYKALGEGAITQIGEEELSRVTDGFDNSIAILVWHISGNLRSRFTDFLDSDGEKPWRGRDEEFVARRVARTELLTKWEEGWTVALASIGVLQDADLEKMVTIRREPLHVYQALHRAVAHVAYHVGQIVYIAKAARGEGWQFMSIPPGQSEEFNRRR